MNRRRILHSSLQSFLKPTPTGLQVSWGVMFSIKTLSYLSLVNENFTITYRTVERNWPLPGSTLSIHLLLDVSFPWTLTKANNSFIQWWPLTGLHKLMTLTGQLGPVLTGACLFHSENPLRSWSYFLGPLSTPAHFQPLLTGSPWELWAENSPPWHEPLADIPTMVAQDMCHKAGHVP